MQKVMGRGGRILWLVLGTAALLLFWELAARAAGAAIILPGPRPVLVKLWELVKTGRFLESLAYSVLRVVAGVLIAAPLGIAAGILSGLNPKMGAFLRPLFTVISATPVMALILIAFLVLGQNRTPVFTAFLMVFPVMTASVMEGVTGADKQFRELFVLYRLSRAETLRFLYLPALAPFIAGGLRASLSLCWKVVIAAEVLVQPARALGTGMQNAKAQLETPELFAWTAATVIAAALSQMVFSLLLKRRSRGSP